MKKVKFYIDTGFVGCDIEEIMEYEDDVTEEEIEEDLECWKDERINYGYLNEDEF